jgi:hypothetical protein
MSGAPNLDCMTDSDLAAFAESPLREPVRKARAMFPERPRGYVTARYDLNHYAWNLKAARYCRTRGDITGAQVYEDICERIYARLPEFARW